MMFMTACAACGLRASQPSPDEVGNTYDGLCFRCQADVTWHRQQGSRYGAAGCHCDLCWTSHLEAAEMGASFRRGSRARYRRAVEARVAEWEDRGTGWDSGWVFYLGDADDDVEMCAYVDALDAEHDVPAKDARERIARAVRRARRILERLA